MNGIERIAEERRRQVEVEGWTPEHDAAHSDGELVDAAVAYAIAAQDGSGASELWWPWHMSYYKPTPNDRIRELAKAGALIAAEIDRLIAVQPARQEPAGE